MVSLFEVKGRETTKCDVAVDSKSEVSVAVCAVSLVGSSEPTQRATVPPLPPTPTREVEVFAWGAAGGAENGNMMAGGPGGFSTARMLIKTGTQLTIMVGQGGAGVVYGPGGVVPTTRSSFGGGGSGGCTGTPRGYSGGGGGGCSAVMVGGVPLVVAGGGGGSSINHTTHGYGGGGGGETGSADGDQRKRATQEAPGGWGDNSPQCGDKFRGGDGSNVPTGTDDYGGGGGGGGLYGGGGGHTCSQGDSGGGGGSGYVVAPTTTATTSSSSGSGVVGDGGCVVGVISSRTVCGQRATARNTATTPPETNNEHYRDGAGGCVAPTTGDHTVDGNHGLVVVVVKAGTTATNKTNTDTHVFRYTVQNQSVTNDDSDEDDEEEVVLPTPTPSSSSSVTTAPSTTTPSSSSTAAASSTKEPAAAAAPPQASKVPPQQAAASTPAKAPAAPATPAAKVPTMPASATTRARTASTSAERRPTTVTAAGRRGSVVGRRGSRAGPGGGGDDDPENDFDSEGRPLNARGLAKVIATAVSQAPRQFREPNCSPIREALRLMKGNPTGEAKALDQFCKSADFAMNSVVEAYYEGFNKSIKSCSTFLEIVSTAEDSSEQLMEYITQSRIFLDKNVSALKTEWVEYLEQNDMIDLIDKIKWLGSSTREIEELVKARWFVHAAALLRRAIDVSTDLGLLKVNALQDISVYLVEMKQDFTTTVTKKICDHVYLRYSPTSASKPQPVLDSSLFRMNDNSTFKGLVLDSVFLSQEDWMSVTDPEADPRVFLKNCVASLEKLGLATSVAVQLQNAKSEIIRLLEENKIKVQQSSSSHQPSVLEEAKDFVAAFQSATDSFCKVLKNHGYLSQVFKSLSPTSTYNISTIWSQAQDVFKDALVPYLFAALNDSISTTPLLGARGSKIFSFENSSSYFFEAAMRNSARTSVPVDLKSISKLYPILTQFDDKVLDVFDCNQFAPPVATPLRDFLKTFTQQKFIPHLEKDTKNKIRLALETSDSFRPSETPYKSGVPLMQCAPKMIALLEDLIGVVQSFEGASQRGFVSLFEETVMGFFEKCTSVYALVLGIKPEERPLTLTAILLTGPDCATWIEQLQSDPLWPGNVKGITASLSTQKIGRDKGAFSFYECEALLDRYVHDPTFVVQREQLILEQQRIALLGSLCESLDWCAHRIQEICEATKKTAQNRKQSSDWRTFLEQKLVPIVSGFKDLANNSLMALRLEIRLHCFHFLSQFKGQTYTKEEKMPQPDTFIVELNKDLIQVEETLIPLLSERKSRFVIDGLALLIGALLIRSVSTMSAVNSNAISKLCKNVFTLQQNLTHTIHKKEFHFDRARRYFELLALDEQELLEHITEQSEQGATQLFQFEEYRTLLEVRKPHRKVDPMVLKELTNKLPVTIRRDAGTNPTNSYSAATTPVLTSNVATLGRSLTPSASSSAPRSRRM
ncbi:exocyst complex subunit 4 [Pelomyxa schiedti]|nr:exocyst complex subunit 4 [Pelomyxa schiedti]